jgi:4a-hydroxytetrahydrobiopterin dehydratase
MRFLAVFLITINTVNLYSGDRTVIKNTLPMIEPGTTPEDRAHELREKKCLPCEGKLKPLSCEDEDSYALATPHWEIKRSGTHKIVRQFLFKTFQESIRFVTAIAEVAEEEHHHPTIQIFFNSVLLELYTHAITGLSENDFILAARIDEIAQKTRFRGRKK